MENNPNTDCARQCVPLLECRNLRKTYGVFNALNGITMTIPRGKIVGLLGPNGSGKTTLIKLISGLLAPSSGEILINGEPVSPKTKAVVSYLPERPYFSAWMHVNEMIEYFCDFYADFDKNRAYEMLRELGINPEAQMKTLSKGTKEKVQLVMVMSRRAQLYLLDEPIAGVDPAARDYIIRTIICNYDPAATIIISTHLITDIESILDEFLFISGGQIFMNGTVDETREKYQKSIDQLFREVFRC